MFLMGVSLTLDDVVRVARRPWLVALGIGAHYVVMPLAGWAVAALLRLPPELAVGVILVGCAPSGTASNVMTYLAKGDVALAVSIAAVSTILAPVLMPVLTLWLAGQLVAVPTGAMVTDIVKTVLVPVTAGVVTRRLLPHAVHAVAPSMPWLSITVIAFIVAVVMSGSTASFASAGWLVLLAVVMHNAAGLLLGCAAGRVCRLDTASRRALTFEVAMQNSGLAASLATAYFSPAAALAPAVFSVWHNVSGAVVAALMARRSRTRDPEGPR
jgi:BASS family bile acid:Na+ symporter